MPALSNAVRRLIFAPGTKDDRIRLVTIHNPNWLEPLRFCDLGLEMEVLDDGVRRYTVSNGVTYEEAIASSRSGDDVPDDLPSAQLLLDNVQYQTAELLEEDLTGATIDLVLVRKDDPDEVVETIEGWEFVSGQAGKEVTSFEVALDPDDQDEPAVSYTMNKANARGLFL